MACNSNTATTDFNSTLEILVKWHEAWEPSFFVDETYSPCNIDREHPLQIYSVTCVCQRFCDPTEICQFADTYILYIY